MIKERKTLKGCHHKELERKLLGLYYYFLHYYNFCATDRKLRHKLKFCCSFFRYNEHLLIHR